MIRKQASGTAAASVALQIESNDIKSLSRKRRQKVCIWNGEGIRTGMHGHAVDEDQAGSMRIYLVNGQVQGNLVIINVIIFTVHTSKSSNEKLFSSIISYTYTMSHEP